MKKIFAIALAALTVFAASCVKDKMYEGPSSIDEMTLNPAAPTSIQDVTVTIKTGGLQQITKAEINYNGTTVAMTGSGNSWSGVIPALPDKTNVKVKVTVTNSAGYTTSKDTEYTVGNPPTDWTKLVINELDASEADDAAKFLEFYNNGDFDISMKDITIIKNDEEGAVWTGIAGEVCPAHGYFVIQGVKDKTGRGISAGVSPKKSVKLEVIAPDGKTSIDKIQHGNCDDQGVWDQKVTITPEAGISWSRIPNGTGKYMMAEATKGKTNATNGTEDPEVK